MTHPDGVTNTRAYDARGLLSEVALAGNLISNRGYEASGRMVENSLGNSLTETRSYLPGSHLVETIQVPGVTDFAYTYDLTREVALSHHSCSFGV